MQHHANESSKETHTSNPPYPTIKVKELIQLLPEVRSHHLQQLVQLCPPEAATPHLQLLQLLELYQMETAGGLVVGAELEDDPANVGTGGRHQAHLLLAVEMLLF
jgi:hypothetical protein